MLPNLAGTAEEQVRRLDGVVLTGGADVSPDRYGAARQPQTGPSDQGRDAFELELVEAARRLDKPVLGICRGFQVIAVQFGATLCQHLPDETDGTIEHFSSDLPPSLAHPVRFDLETATGQFLAARGFGKTRLVNSYHHQGIFGLERVPPGLRPVAVAPDGVVEAMELPPTGSRLPRLLAVQWHPELLVATDADHHLWPFEWLLRAATRTEED